MFSFQVTIRASLTGKTPVVPISPDRSSFTISPDTLRISQKTKPPVNVSKSKSNVSGAGKPKTTQSKKQEGRTTKHNLALRNLRLLTDLFHTVVGDITTITHFIFMKTLTHFCANTDWSFVLQLQMIKGILRLL